MGWQQLARMKGQGVNVRQPPGPPRPAGTMATRLHKLARLLPGSPSCAPDGAEPKVSIGLRVLERQALERQALGPRIPWSLVALPGGPSPCLSSVCMHVCLGRGKGAVKGARPSPAQPNPVRRVEFEPTRGRRCHAQALAQALAQAQAPAPLWPRLDWLALRGSGPEPDPSSGPEEGPVHSPASGRPGASGAWSLWAASALPTRQRP